MQALEKRPKRLKNTFWVKTFPTHPLQPPSDLSVKRNQFLNIVNPYLEQVQANAGLNAFRVVMDATNNTDETIDRNMLIGQIFLQPSRTAEFIVLDFIVQPTGAAFPE